MKCASPLDKKKYLPNIDLYLKREDLLEYGGGNKVRRFEAFFEKYKNIETVVTMSNPGSHTFFVLNEFIKSTKYSFTNMLFLERKMQMNPYNRYLRKKYVNNKNITVSQNNFFFQLFVFLKYKFFSSKKYKTIGIGGSLSLKPNAFETAFDEVLYQLKSKRKKNKVYHIFPIASGTMANGLIRGIKKNDVFNHKLIGVTTGAFITHFSLRLKYFFNSFISFAKPRKYSYKEYLHQATNFYDQYSVWLDPVHAIHIADSLNSNQFKDGDTVVLWITNPRMDGLISN